MTARPLAGGRLSRFADLERRFRGFEVPGRVLSPVALAPLDLSRFGLPPQPDREAQPDAHKVWMLAFGGEIALRPFAFDAELRREIETTTLRIAARRLDAGAATASPFETSRNWAGAYLTANRGMRFGQIWGAWQIPAALRAPPPAHAGTPGLPFACSNWIGLDGQRRYIDSSLPQIGTISVLRPDGSTQAWAWVQWWAKTAAGNRPLMLPLAAAPGDRVVCVLTALTAQSVVAVIVNLSPPIPVGMAVLMGAPSVDVGGFPVVPRIAGATAEWIVERPSIPFTSDMANLPDYGCSEFESCYAVEGLAPAIGALASGLPQNLHGARLIRMLETRADPARITTLSLARRVDSETLQVTYGGLH